MATRMAARHGKLCEFQAGVDNVEDYKERFLLYCTANGITDDDKKIAVLLTSMGTTTYTLLKNLVRPAAPQDKSLNALFKLLQDHYEPRIIVVAERFRFYKRMQREGENIAVYVSELRRLAKHCDFGEQLNTALRDQLVCGLLHENMQQKILAEAGLTLEKALRIAQAAETARAETRHLRGSRHDTQLVDIPGHWRRHLLSRERPQAAAANRDRCVLWIRHVIVAMIMVMTQPSVDSQTTRVCSARRRAISLKHV